GRAENSNGCVTRPKGREIGLSGFAAQIQLYSLTGSYVMATAEHREPYESRGSRTVLGARGGEIPPRDSTMASKSHAKPLSLRPLSGPCGVARRRHGIYAPAVQPRELARNATDDRRHHQGEYRRRRHRLEHPGPDLRPQASEREFVRLARHFPARHVRAAAYP